MSPAVVVLRFSIRVYQAAISPFFPAHCRYWPSCSAYTAEAVRNHGALAGSWLGVRRIMRCHPWGSSGFDPVPEPYCGQVHSPKKTPVTEGMEQGT